MRHILLMGAGCMAAFGGAADAASFSTLYRFSGGADGGLPGGNLIAAPGGGFYGTTEAGGASGNGTFFRVDPPAHGFGPWIVTTLYSFAGGSDGAAPTDITADAAGNIYGTSSAGGGGAACTVNGTVVGCGTVFELSPASGGGWQERVLHAFQGVPDGQRPIGLSFDGAGNLYGFAVTGGSGVCHFQGTPFGCGTAYVLRHSGGGWAFSLLYTFAGDTDGESPYGPPLIDRQGALIGETGNGGLGAPAACEPATGCGQVFRLVPPAGGGRWTKEVLWNFHGTDGVGGSNPLVADAAGNLYGMTNEGGPPNPLCPEYTSFGAPAGCGVAFRLSPPANKYVPWKYQTIWNFTLGTDSGYPFNTALTPAYGRWFAASSGPYPLANSYGAIVEFTPQAGGGWGETTLFTFSNDAVNEAQPVASLSWVGKRLYGTAQGYGMTGSWGTVFRVRP